MRRVLLDASVARDFAVLAATFEMSLTGLKKHVAVLEGAGLVSTEKIGRARHCRLGPRRLEEEVAFIASYRAMLEARLGRLNELLEQTKGAAT